MKLKFWFFTILLNLGSCNNDQKSFSDVASAEDPALQKTEF